MPTAITPPYPATEIAERGERLYKTVIQPLVGADHHGERIVIDIKTGAYAFDQRDDPLAASYSLIEKKTNAVLYAIRVGFPATTKMGGGWRTSSGEMTAQAHTNWHSLESANSPEIG